ncbi:MAG: NAD(P)-dependent oxidoreductase [Chloroflexota bacterium]
MPEPGVPRVAFVGLGAMGGPMAQNVARAGLPLAVFDVSAPRCAPVVAAGARLANNPSEATLNADITVMMVRTHDQLRAALDGELGVYSAIGRGTTLVVMSTVAPGQARALAAECAERGVQFLDAPVSGGVPGAESGTLTIMAGGSTAAFEAARPVLQAMSGPDKLWHVGPNPGDGETMKMINQVLVGINIVGSCEAVALARASGLDLDVMRRIVGQSMGASRIFVERAQRIIEGEVRTGRNRLDILVKDMGIVSDTADRLGIPLMVAAAAHQAFKLAAANGLAEADDDAVIELYE